MAPLAVQKRMVIAASPEVVWKVHTDINAWSQWHSSISSARALSPLAVGSSFEWKSGGLTIASTIQSLEPNRRISWTGKSIGTQAKHVWILEAQNGSTLVTTEESMEGWLVSLLKLFTPTFLDKSLDVWLRDLKNKAEATSKEPLGTRVCARQLPAEVRVVLCFQDVRCSWPRWPR
jgi:uncharacterized protein YndB with AHSA1/START domain